MIWLGACAEDVADPGTPPELDPPRVDSGVESLPAGLVVSPGRGLYTEPLTVAVSEGALCSVDGTTPTEACGSVEISSTTVLRVRLGAEEQVHSYLFLADVPDQAPAWPESWWTGLVEGGLPADYGVDPEIVAAYPEEFPGSLEALPILSLVLPPEDLFGAAGIYENPTEEGDEWERATSVELFVDGERLQLGAGLRIHGNASRNPEASPKKSFRLAFRREYSGDLEWPLFEGCVGDYDGLILRAGYNFTWVHWGADQRAGAQYRRDELARVLSGDLGLVGTHGRPVQLFLDGVHWGLYTLHERPDAGFLARHLGGEEEDWDAINTGEAVDGDRGAWIDLLAAVRAGVDDATLATVQENWLDLAAFSDYYLLNLYLGNTDWPGNNWFAGRRREEGQPFHFFAWDAEHVMEDVADDVTGSTGGTDSPGELFGQLLENPEFVVLFGDRVQRALFHGGPLSETAVAARWEELGEELWRPVVAESARWGDYRRDVYPYSEEPYELYTRDDHWLVEDARIREEWIPARGTTLLSQLRAAGLFPAVDAPEVEPWGGEVAAGTTVSLGGAGTVYLTLDGSDPRASGGAVGTTALAAESLVIEGDTSLKARVWTGTDWSALVEVDFVVK